MDMSTSSDGPCIPVDDELLSRWPLPDPAAATDKDDRGRILLVGGSAEMPGALVLAALGAMRAGAGKLCLATARSISAHIAQAIPEARVIALEETREGGLLAPTIGELPICHVDAILIGPGMQDTQATQAITRAILAGAPTVPVVLDALALETLKVDDWQTLIDTRMSAPHATNSKASSAIVITPHAGEMASLLQLKKSAVENDKQRATVSAAKRWRTLVAGKGATTHIASPAGEVWIHAGGNVGLATSGSGDVLAGVITGLCARGAPVEQATAWAVRLHALAGDQLVQRYGRVGYLAREIPEHIPRLMEAYAEDMASTLS
ncbi:MAG: NAD(P)H-hydrate dehydratase [Steroidobacteraceae bacterium]